MTLKKLGIAFGLLLLGFLIGVLAFVFVSNHQMENYGLYNCIYNNAAANNFNQNPIMVQEITYECVCAWEHNFTNLSEVDCRGRSRR